MHFLISEESSGVDISIIGAFASFLQSYDTELELIYTTRINIIFVHSLKFNLSALLSLSRLSTCAIAEIGKRYSQVT